jgi:hypothetical protein
MDKKILKEDINKLLNSFIEEIEFFENMNNYNNKRFENDIQQYKIKKNLIKYILSEINNLPEA